MSRRRAESRIRKLAAGRLQLAESKSRETRRKLGNWAIRQLGNWEGRGGQGVGIRKAAGSRQWAAQGEACKGGRCCLR